MKQEQNVLTKPLLRGHSHQAAFFFAFGACVMLIAHAGGSNVKLATIVYSLSLIGLFGISALYHRPTWNPQKRMLMRRLDHAAIYILIAGTLTPICLVGLNSQAGLRLLQIGWGAALFGIFHSLAWVTAPKWISSILYITMGCLALPYLPELAAALSKRDLVFLLVGGAFYISGAIIYALKKPNPFPAIFGYHEIFHLLVIVGAFFHFLVIHKLVN